MSKQLTPTLLQRLLRDAAVNRGVELGPYPLEALPTDAAIYAREAGRPSISRTQANPFFTATNDTKNQSELTQAVRDHLGYYRPFLTGERAILRAPIPDDLALRTREIKGAAYYLDASHVGICKLPETAWCTDATHKDPVADSTHAIVVLVAHGRAQQPGTLAADWLGSAAGDVARLRAMEIVACVAGHIRTLGFAARAQIAGETDLDLNRLAVMAGIAQRQSNDTLTTPFLANFELAVICTNYALATDEPLATNARPSALRHWLGINGATSGREHNRINKRPTHYSRYPMEQLERVERPTTLILDDEIPRVPQRANFFMRTRAGDLGPKAQREVSRFASKHPLTAGMMGPLRALAPHQDDDPLNAKSSQTNHLTDQSPQTNSDAIRALAYHLGVDLVGICEVPDYAWYSHRPDGSETATCHKYAVVMLIDQGYDTMEGASGDDWISGCQSMRGYLRGAEIAGVMANFLRRKGVSARPQTNADSDVLQIPLVLLAGLGELSRIGELVLNPFVGPRFKSVVLTTDLPLEVDQPIDFGLQEFCSGCLKCARECPVNAIPFGDKVMFNGYEIWKPDVERCTTYRVTNPKGSACGRCMKTCPLNKVVTADGAVLHRVGSWLGVNARWLKKWLVPIAVSLDDKLGFGTRNPIKRWWLDLEIVDDEVRAPRGTNERDLDLSKKTTGKKTPVGYYHAADMPAPDNTNSVPTNHREAIKRAEQLETVADARERRATGGARPAHYIAVSEADNS